MFPCGKFLSELPENFPDLPVREAIEILAVNHAVDATEYFQCKRKQEELAQWIDRNKQ
jgi:hypothetical protein